MPNAFRMGLCLILVICCFAAAPTTQSDLASSAIQALEAGKLKQFAAAIEAEIKPLLEEMRPADVTRRSAPAGPDFKRLTELTTWREFARYFDRLGKPSAEQLATLRWLAGKPQLLATLMMAVGDSDSPERVLQVLGALQADQKDRLEEYADLTAAMCVVWDSPPAEFRRQSGEDKTAAHVQMLMRHYSSPQQRFRFNLRQLPWQLCVYVAPNVVSREEIAWAVRQYAQRGAIGGAYFDVPYDKDKYYGSGSSQRTDQAYTLQSLVQRGGVCADQAYFATQVARCVGVPAAACTGQGAGGEAGHAWVGYLDLRGGRYAWNFDEGRYPELQFWRGDVVDPQTGQKITEADLSLLAELASVKPADRLASDALCKLADLLEGAPQVDIFIRAVNLCAGNPRAWYGLARLDSQQKLTAEQSAQFRAALARFAARRYPDFAFNLMKLAISGRPADQRLAALDEMKALFDASRPDIMAAIALARGDVHRDENRQRQALAAYMEVLDRYGSAGPIIMDALEHVDQLLRQNQDLRTLAAIYQKAWQKLPAPEASTVVRGTPYYIVGQKYAKLLQELGQQAEARSVRVRLDALTAAADSPKQTPTRKH